MAKIKSEDIVQKDLLKQPIEEAIKFLEAITKIKAELLEVSKIQIKKNDLTDSEKVKAFTIESAKASKTIREINDLNKESERLKKQLSSSTDEEIRGKIRLQKANKEQRDILKDQLILQDKEAGTLQKLNALNRQLRRERDKINASTKEGSRRIKEINIELDKNNIKIDKNSDRLKKQLRNVGNYKSALGGLRSALLRVGAVFGVAGGVDELVRRNAQFSDSLADIQKTTGLTAQEVDRLSDALQKLDTRTSQVDLLGIATAGGRLGIAKDELFGFTQAIDQVFVALGDELSGTAEDIATDLAKISEIFDVTEQFGVAEGITKIGSAINFLGANTKAQSAFIVDFTKRLTGARELTNISAVDVLGLAATLDELGQSVEVSGTATSQILIRLGQNTQAFAEASGQDIEEFTKLVNTDINQALIAFAQGITNSNKTTTELSGSLTGLGIDGVRSSNVVLALAKNTDLLQKNQELANKSFTDGTSVVDEFNIKNNNLAANLEKLGRVITDKIVNSGFTRFLKDATAFLLRNISAIGSAIKVLAVLTAGVVAYRIVQSLSNKESKIAILLTKLYGLAQQVLAAELKIATIAQKAFNVAVKANPLGLILGLLASAAAAYIAYSDDVDDATQSQEDFNNELEKTRLIIRDIDPQEIAGRIVAGLDLTKLSLRELTAAAEAFKAELGALSLASTILVAIEGETPEEFAERQRIAFESNRASLIRLIAAVDAQIKATTDLNETDAKRLGLIEEIEKRIGELNKIQKESRDPAIIRQAEAEIKLLNEKKKALTDVNDIELMSFIIKERVDKDNQEAIKRRLNQFKLEERARKKAIADAKKAEEEIREFFVGTTNALEVELKKRNAEQVKEQDKVIDAQENAIAVQERRAEQGLSNTLAFEKEQLAQAQLEKKRLQEEQERQEKVLIYLRAVAEFMKTDPNTAPAKALAQTLIAESIAGAFAHGVEDFKGKGTETSDSNLIRFSKGESVATAKGTKENPGLVTAMNKGRDQVERWAMMNILPKYIESQSLTKESVEFSNINSTASIDKQQINDLLSELKGLRAEVKNKREVNVHWQSHDTRVEKLVENGMTKVIKTLSSKPRV